MGDPETPEAIVAAAIEAYGCVDIVVNNAANALAQAIGAMTPEAMAKSWEVQHVVVPCCWSRPHSSTSGRATMQRSST